MLFPKGQVSQPLRHKNEQDMQDRKKAEQQAVPFMPSHQCCHTERFFQDPASGTEKYLRNEGKKGEETEKLPTLEKQPVDTGFIPEGLGFIDKGDSQDARQENSGCKAENPSQYSLCYRFARLIGRSTYCHPFLLPDKLLSPCTDNNTKRSERKGISKSTPATAQA